MAKALKCDRCGKYYDLHKPPHIIDYNVVGSSKDSVLDLCDDCYVELRTFLHLEKEDTNEQMEASDTDDTDNS